MSFDEQLSNNMTMTYKLGADGNGCQKNYKHNFEKKIQLVFIYSKFHWWFYI